MRPQNPQQQQRLTIIVSVVVVAIAAAAFFIFASSKGDSGEAAALEDIPTSRTSDGAFILGNPDAPVTIVEFADFLCPHCQEYEPTIQRFIEEYVATGQAKLEYRGFPVIDPNLSVYAYQLAECADTLRPGAFWEARSALFNYAGRQRFDRDAGRAIAEELGLDYAAMLECTSNANQIMVDYQVGQNAGIQGTPAVMIRYGDNAPLQFLGQQYARGSVPFEVLALTVASAQVQ